MRRAVRNRWMVRLMASAAFLVTTSVTLVYEGSLRTYWSNKFSVLLERERVWDKLQSINFQFIGKFVLLFALNMFQLPSENDNQIAN